MPVIGIDARKIRDFGIGTYVRNLVRGLAQLDQENEYVLLVGPNGPEALAGLPANFRLLLEGSKVYSVRELFALSWRLWRLKLDLYHATHYVLPLVVPCKSVVTIHDIIHLLYPEFLPSRLAFFYARRMIRRTLSRSDRVIAVSQNTRSDLLRFLDADGRKIEVVFNGVDAVFHQRLSTEDLTRWQRQLGIAPPYLLFVGNPKPHKNLDNVIQAYAKAQAIHAFDADLVCVGGNPEADLRTRQRAEAAGVAQRIRLLGQVPDEALPAIYQGATLFLYPTLYEGFGLPVIEAMASGVPVITSNTSALREIGEGYAHLVNPLDVEALARAIAQQMADPQHRASLAELGLRRAREFSWERTARRTLAVYKSVLEGTPISSLSASGTWPLPRLEKSASGTYKVTPRPPAPAPGSPAPPAPPDGGGASRS
jgi:glycosyltransferase involved in cell wall biosynthesis